MQSIRYRVTTLSPLIFPLKAGDPNMVSTKEYIPGGVIKGFFAYAYIKKKNLGENAHRDNGFYDLFLSGKVRFTNAYKIADHDRKQYKTYPIPLSIQEDKYNKGIIYDLLIADDNPEMQTIPVGGFGWIEGNNIFTETIKKSLNFHHQTDRRTGTPEEGIIFNYESIDKGQTFEGIIIGDGLSELPSILNKEHIAFLGRSRGAQYGKAKIELLDSDSSHVHDIEVDSDGTIMTMLSDTIIYNDCGFATTDFNTLESLLKEKIGSHIKIERAFIKSEDVETFVSVWRLRSPCETAFAAGSCFLIKGLEEKDRDALIKLQEEGIGERRTDGFGAVAFGLQRENILNRREKGSKKKQTKPDIPIPSKAQDIIKDVLKNHIRKHIEFTAINEAKGFKNLPSKSLIGKLELMVRNMSRAEFVKTLEDLRKPAKHKLERCNNGRKSLLDFLKDRDSDVRVEKVLKKSEMAKIKKLSNAINISLQGDNSFEIELYQTYFRVFFSVMRKESKSEEEKSDYR